MILKKSLEISNWNDMFMCFREPKKTKVMSYLQSELGGMLPQSIVENALPSNILDFYSCLKQQLHEDGHIANGHLQNGDS